MTRSKMEGSRPISVCHVLPALPAHGAEQLLLDISRHLDRDRVRFSVCLISDLGPLVEDFRKLGIPVTFIPKKGRIDPTIILRLAQFWRQQKVDIVHTHLFTADLWGRLAGMFSRLPFVSTSHTTSDPNIGRLGAWLDQILDCRNSAVICVSKAVRRYRIEEAGFNPKKCYLIENGIDLDRFIKKGLREGLQASLGFPNIKHWIVIVGRLVPLKGHRFLIKALSILMDDFPDWGLLIVGEGESEASLRDQTKNMGLSNRVAFLGLRRDIPDILAISEIMVLPSSREGLPIVLLEAMAASLPVVVTPVGGIPEVVVDGKTGLFVTQDAVSIARELRKLLENPDLRNSIGKNARTVIEAQFDVRKVAREYEFLYYRILSNKKVDIRSFSDGGRR